MFGYIASTQFYKKKKRNRQEGKSIFLTKTHTKTLIFLFFTFKCDLFENPEQENGKNISSSLINNYLCDLDSNLWKLSSVTANFVEPWIVVSAWSFVRLYRLMLGFKNKILRSGVMPCDTYMDHYLPIFSFFWLYRSTTSV